MREKLSQKVLNLKSSGIRAFFDMANEIPDVISLGVGEPDFDTPWHIREAGIQALQSGKTFYTSNAGLQELRAAISSYTKRKTGLTYNPENQIIVTVGGSEAIDLALRALLNAGDEVIYLEPGFVSYYPCIKLADGVPVPIRLTEENRFRLKPEQLEAAVTPKSKVLILSYPNNPTGAVMEKEDLEALLPVIQKHDLIVISDEIYGELTYGVKHCSIAGLPGMEQRTIIINGFSKSFAMTGWRLGYALGNHEIIEQMVKIHQFAVMCAPTISQYAAIEAMEQGDGDIEAMTNFTAQNYGAGKIDRVIRGGKSALAMGVGISILISIVICLFPSLFISLFNRDPGVVQIGNGYLRTVSVFYLIFAAMQILNGLLLGYGKALVPMIASIGSLCLLQVPTAILLSGTELAYRGIWIAAPVGWLGGLLIRFLYFRHIARKQAALKEA